MRRLITMQVSGRGSHVDCGTSCATISIVIEFGNPHALTTLIGHADIAINDHFYDYGPDKGKKPNLGVIDAGGEYWPSEHFKRKAGIPQEVDLHSLKQVERYLEDIAEGYVVIARICTCKKEAALIEERMKEMIKASTYSVPGQQCASSVYGSYYNTSGSRKSSLSPQGLLFRFINRETHQCGPNKGKLIDMEWVKKEYTPHEN